MAIKKNGVLIDEKKQNKPINIEDDSPSPSPSYLPEDLIFENVLTRLPAKSLIRFACVSKSWSDYILNDKTFAVSHFAHNQNRRSLTFNLLNVPRKNHVDGEFRSYFFNLQRDGHDNDCFYNFESSWRLHSVGRIEFVGNCNGLTCFRIPSEPGFEKVSVMSSFRKEPLNLVYSIPEIEGGEGSRVYDLCHGFGFDALSQEYKVVVIYLTEETTVGVGDQGHGFICMVATLGDPVWREIVINPYEVSPPPGRPSFPSRMMIILADRSITFHGAATICGGDLLWRITISSLDDDYAYYDDKWNHEIEMLLSFDIHNERLQFIRLPNECNSLITKMNGGDCLELRHHLLEFKGYPCVARSEKIYTTERVGTQSNDLRFIHYQIMVHLYVLKDKVNQVWMEEETFDVRLVEPDSLLLDPFDRYFHKTRRPNNHRWHPTHMFGFSDQVILYWFDGGCLIFYNLRMKHHKVVKGTRSCNNQIHDIFEAKITELQDPNDSDGSDNSDDSADGYVHNCPFIDYQLFAQVENIISLESFHS